MTEADIQNVLYAWLSKRGHRLICPNLDLYFYESDLVSVTRADYSHEYEIKRTLSDFKADFKKKSKHNTLRRVDLRSMSGIFNDGQRTSNYFWYVIAGFDLFPGLVPKYAGHIQIDKCEGKTITGAFRVRVIKPAPRLHTNRISSYQKERILQGSYYRFWNTRIYNDLCNKYKIARA